MSSPEPNDPAIVKDTCPEELMAVPALLTLPATYGFETSIAFAMDVSRFPIAVMCELMVLVWLVLIVFIVFIAVIFDAVVLLMLLIPVMFEAVELLILAKLLFMNIESSFIKSIWVSISAFV